MSDDKRAAADDAARRCWFEAVPVTSTSIEPEADSRADAQLREQRRNAATVLVRYYGVERPMCGEHAASFCKHRPEADRLPLGDAPA